MKSSRPWRTVPSADLALVHGVLTDIDDTLTQDGLLDPHARVALQALRDAAVPVIAVTGRPAGWSVPFAQAGPQGWPLDAIVAENGAVALVPDAAAPDGVRWAYAQDDRTRTANERRLAQAQDLVLREVPDAVVSTDSPGRITDIAFDHSEHVQRDEAHVRRIVELLREQGLTVTVSSIHVNAWFGTHDKWSGACWITRELHGVDLAHARDRWIYVGDSTNDQVMFGQMPLSVGVANLRRFADQLEIWPTYITDGERGAGFADVARALLDARRATRHG